LSKLRMRPTSAGAGRRLGEPVVAVHAEGAIPAFRVVSEVVNRPAEEDAIVVAAGLTEGLDEGDVGVERDEFVPEWIARVVLRGGAEDPAGPEARRRG
jgi:hypothetical protein